MQIIIEIHATVARTTPKTCGALRKYKISTVTEQSTTMLKTIESAAMGFVSSERLMKKNQHPVQSIGVMIAPDNTSMETIVVHNDANKKRMVIEVFIARHAA